MVVRWQIINEPEYKIQDIYYEFSAHIGAHTEACNG